MDSQDAGSNGWFDLEGQQVSGGDVLSALSDFQRALAEWRRRSRSRSGVGDSDFLALQLLLDAEARGRAIGPKDLKERLGITSAATTMLVDRLVGSGHVRREQHPTDRRALILRPTSLALDPYPSLAALNELFDREAAAMEPGQATAVASFLLRLTTAVDSLDTAVVQ
ncbi:MarR family transcriptional regulator [Paenarthrobacter sp. S56]|uniref:MarR family winged helix-turn-helix transcriptional regulator n=1 Tax=Paenarthrobacter sp. S56 TaxID=3138179 RepID=UPI00321AF511